jgi:DNA-binding response OmpR family regulator
MNTINILWADDEIDLLKPHILFLKEKGYEVKTAKSGDEAVGMIKTEHAWTEWT